MSRGLGKNQKKIILLLLGGVALGFSRSPRQYFYILKKLKKDWREIDRQSTQRALNGLYKSKLLKEIEGTDGTTTFILTDKGKKKALTFKIDDMHIRKPSKWDRQWRIIMFDIPEYMKKQREAFRSYLKQLGCVELQKSVFVHPYDCNDEIDFLIELHNIRKFVRYIVARSIDNEYHLKKTFKIS